jgi:DNA repair protein RecO (recombination protein O)
VGVRVSLHPGVVLHRRPYRETSLLLEVFTAEHGRLGAVARGGRSPRASQAALLQPFRPLLLSWTGRHELLTLTAVEPSGRPYPLHGRALLSGLYLNELVLRLVQRADAHPPLYDAYLKALQSLADSGLEEPVLRLFEKHLLQALGYALVLEAEAGSGRPLREDERYRYQPDAGPVPEAVAAGAGVPVSGRALLALAREDLSADTDLRELKALMRTVLGQYLGERPLLTRQLFRRRTDPRDGATRSTV